MSKNAVGIIILILSLVGVEVDENTVIEFISALGTVVSIVLLVWNQFDRKDIKWFFWKKK